MMTPINIADAFAEVEIKGETVSRMYCNLRQLKDLAYSSEARFDACFQLAEYTWKERWFSWLPWPLRTYARRAKSLNEQQGWIFGARVFLRESVPDGFLVLVCASGEHTISYVPGVSSPRKAV